MVQYVYAVAGAKGGVGKTTTSINLGTAFADLGWSVIVVEADLAMANVVDFLDVDADPRADPTLHDVLDDGAPVETAIYEAPGGVDVLPSGVDLEGFAAADLRRLDDVVDELRAAYDVILLDAGAGLSRETLYPPAIADGTILVSSPRVASVRDAEKTKALTERVGGAVEGVVFVESGTGTAPPVERIADFLDVDLLGHVPEDEAVPVSQDAGQPVIVHAEDSPSASAYREIASDLEASLLERDDPDVPRSDGASTHSAVEPDGGATVAVREEDPGDGGALDATDSGGATLAAASGASDLLDEGTDLEADESVIEFWEGIEDELPGSPREWSDEVRDGKTDTTEGKNDGMPDPPSESAPIGSVDESGAGAASDGLDDALEDGVDDALETDADVVEADPEGDDPADDESTASDEGSIAGRLRGLLGSALSL